MHALPLYPTFFKAMELYFSQEYEAAYPLLMHFAKQGHPTAQCAIGIMHHMGLGVQVDFVKATFWYELAAEQGDKIAAENLAFFAQIVRKTLDPVTGQFRGF